MENYLISFRENMYDGVHLFVRCTNKNMIATSLKHIISSEIKHISLINGFFFKEVTKRLNTYPYSCYIRTENFSYFNMSEYASYAVIRLFSREEKIKLFLNE